MKKINMHRELNSILEHNRDGSFSTQASRKAILHQLADELRALGFFNLSIHGLKPKHVNKVIEFWITSGLKSGTLKNRMSQLRWLCKKINKPAIIRRNNAEYGIENRQYVTNISKAKSLEYSVIDQVKDEHLRYSLRLQQEFGLRREEAIKFQPRYALKHGKNGYIKLKASWTKGGRERFIPVRTTGQKKLIAELICFARTGSLIPSDLRYIDQLKKYEGECKRLGLTKLHGLRHAYAQNRYLKMTGWKAPACGGAKSKELSPEQKKTDHQARLEISHELGHGRESITAVYLGR